MNASSTKPVIVLGAGGHAKVLIAALRAGGREIRGVVDRSVQRGAEILGVPALGSDAVVHRHAKNEIELVNGVGALPGNDARWRLSEQFRRAGYRFAVVVHPSALIATDVELAEGAQIMAGCILQPGVRIGVDSIINTRVSIDHDCTIGARCHLAPGATLSGGVSVGDDVFIGVGSSVIHSIAIGEGAVVAAGSIVYRNLPPHARYIQTRQTGEERSDA